MIELRLRGVVGSRIGDALSEVESHCAESDETAHEAFGDPVDYARSLDLPSTTETSPRALLRSVGQTALVSSVAFALAHRRADRTPDGPVTSPVGAAARPNGGVSRGESGNR